MILDWHNTSVIPCGPAPVPPAATFQTSQYGEQSIEHALQSAAVQDEGGSLQGLGDHLAAKHAQERRRAQLGGGDWGNRDTAGVSDLLYKCAPRQDLRCKPCAWFDITACYLGAEFGLSYK
jgi:hypothetical protein